MATPAIIVDDGAYCHPKVLRIVGRWQGLLKAQESLFDLARLKFVGPFDVSEFDQNPYLEITIKQVDDPPVIA